MTDRPVWKPDTTPEERRKVINLAEHYPHLPVYCVLLHECDRAEQLAARVAELEADARRMDWLEANGDFGYYVGREATADIWSVRVPPGYYPSLRAAVDEAAARLPDPEVDA